MLLVLTDYRLQGGEIGVASTKGAGSMTLFPPHPIAQLTQPGTFAFYIKARKFTPTSLDPSSGTSSLSSPRIRSPSIRPESSSGLVTTPIALKLRADYHILLVEDNLINQKVLSKQLRTTGCIVHVANHGGEALDFLSKTQLWNDALPSPPSQSMDTGAGAGVLPPGEKMQLSLILMDLEMPVMDGLAATRRIRDLEREGRVVGHVPIIAVTANTRGEQMDIAREAGMVSLLFFFPACGRGE